MKRSPIPSIVTAAAVGFALVAGTPAPAAAPVSTLALDTFDAAWTLIRDTHFDPAFNGVDWDGVRAELRPRAERAADAAELRPVLEEMVGRLGQSHFAIFPGTAIDRLETRSDGGGGGGV